MMRKPAPRTAAWLGVHLVCVSLVVPPGPARGADEAPPYLAAMGGEYIVVGRQPIGRNKDPRAYAGKARVQVDGHSVKVWRVIDGVETILVGGLETAVVAGLEVLRLRGSGATGGPTFTCLERGDLDNYLRLTCVWTEADEPQPDEPGLEAWFPTGAWRSGEPPSAR